ncbi:MAG TPA: hypothetical protein VD926_04240 [Acidimicrobiales bacterium]|nr:hypothetical protein [Acidimicrobiales bacterium]
MEVVVASVVALSTAGVLVGRSRHHRPRWISPYSVERAAFQRVTRTDTVEFQPSNGVHVIRMVADRDADVVSLNERRHRGIASSIAQHPSNYAS